MIGQTLPPIEGDPESVRALSRSLRSGAAKLAAMNAVLVQIKAGASWSSPAGELFETAVQKSPPVLDALIDRYAGTALALLTFSEELEQAQVRDTAARARHAASTRAYFNLEDLVVAARGTPQEVELAQRQNHAMEALVCAERDHVSAWESFSRADHRLAQRLRQLADDILDDSGFYTVLATMDEFSQEVSSIPPVSRRLPVLGLIGTAGDVAGGVSGVALRVLYGEGSWKEVGVNAAARGAGLGAKGLTSGSLVGSRAASGLADGKRVYAGDRLSTKERFLIGTREELHKQHPKLGRRLDGSIPQSRMVVPLDNMPAMAPTKGLPLESKVQIWRSQARVVTRHQADQLVLDDLRAASAGGANARRMFIAGATLERSVPQLKKEANNLLVDKPEEKRTAPTYP